MKESFRGVGLLELMLSLALIAVLLLMATRYYGVTRIGQTVNTATSTLDAVYAASEQWKASYDSLPMGANLIPSFIKAGFLPSSLSGANANPWGGRISAQAASNAEDLIVTMNQVPINECKLLKARFEHKYKNSVAVSNCDSTGFKVTFLDKVK